MNLLIVPNSFKGTYSATAIAAAMERGARQIDAFAQITRIPIADGGDGTLECFYEALGGTFVWVDAVDAWRRPIKSRYLRLDEHRALIELASTAGLTIAGKKLNPRQTTTAGVGMQIAAAIADGAKEILLAIGGSATNDMGVGMLESLGVVFRDATGGVFHPVGESLSRIRSIDTTALDPKIRDVEFTTLCDVDNPLFGSLGAAYVYAPQKGASKEDVEFLDLELRAFASLLETKYFLKPNFPGAGAAGGTSVAAKLFLNSKVVSGIDAILDLVEFDRRLVHADAVISGEGKLDRQSFYGKVIGGLHQRMASSNRPLLLVCGVNELEDLPKNVFASAIHDPLQSLETTIQNTLQLVEEHTKQLLRAHIK